MEHANDIDTEIVDNEIIDDVHDTVQQSPPLVQQQNLSIAERRANKNKKNS